MKREKIVFKFFQISLERTLKQKKNKWVFDSVSSF